MQTLLVKTYTYGEQEQYSIDDIILNPDDKKSEQVHVYEVFDTLEGFPIYDNTFDTLESAIDYVESKLSKN